MAVLGSHFNYEKEDYMRLAFRTINGLTGDLEERAYQYAKKLYRKQIHELQVSSAPIPPWITDRHTTQLLALQWAPTGH